MVTIINWVFAESGKPAILNSCPIGETQIAVAQRDIYLEVQLTASWRDDSPSDLVILL